jgi:hypothetical protein
VAFPWNSSPYQLATPSLGSVTGGTAGVRPIGTARKLGDHRSVIARAEPNRYFFIDLPSGRHAPTATSLHLPRESPKNIQNMEGFVKSGAPDADCPTCKEHWGTLRPRDYL